MTQKEIEVFQRITKFSIYNGSSYFITSNKEILEKYNLLFNDILLMEKYGLIASQTLSWTKQIGKEISSLCSNDEICTVVSNKSTENLSISYSAYKFTNSGQQLLNLISSQKRKEYFIDRVKDLSIHNPNLDIKAYEIDYINDDNSIHLGKKFFRPKS